MYREDIKQYTKEQTVLEVYSLTIGSEILDWLTKIGFVEAIMLLNIPRIKIRPDCEIDILTASSFMKPHLSQKGHITSHILHKEEGGMDINLDVKNATNVRTPKSSIKETTALKKILENYKNIPMAVDWEQTKDFLLLCKEIAANTNVKSPEVLAFLKAFYDIDFSLLLQNNTDTELVEALITFGTQLTRKHFIFKKHWLNTWGSSCINNISCNHAYNKIMCTKYHFKGLFNDLNVYACFSHFYLPYRLTSSGRLYCNSYFLQLQGHKFTRAFLTFKKQPLPNDQQIKNVLRIMHNAIDTSQQIKFNTCTEYTRASRGLYNEYILSLCYPNTDLKLYPYHENILTNQLLWLNSHCKKPNNIFYLRSLIHGGFQNDYLHRIYQKDATSSGLQIISMLMRDTTLARNTNVSGTESKDIYGELLNIFNTRLHIQKESIDKFCNQVLGLSYNQLLHFPDDESLGYYLKKLFLTNNIDEFTKLYNTVTSHLNKAVSLKTKILEFKFSTTNLTPTALTTKSDDPLFCVLIKAQEYFYNRNLFEQLPENFFSRKLFKHPIMALGYSEGLQSRMHEFDKHLKDCFRDQGYAVSLLTQDQINRVVLILSTCFNDYEQTNLKVVNHFLGLSRKFIKSLKTDKVHIKMKYLSWTLQLIQSAASRHRIRLPNNIVHKFVIYHKFGYDASGMLTSFPSIFIQGIDAHIVQELLHNGFKINEELRKHHLPEIFLNTNHDNFGINVQYALFLNYMVKKAYNTINELHFPEIPGYLPKIKDPIKCTNGNCIKY